MVGCLKTSLITPHYANSYFNLRNLHLHWEEKPNKV
jgi:hypothetical protein